SLAPKTGPDPMHGKVVCAACHASSDLGADLRAILPRCVACHAPEYADYAGAWVSIILHEAHRAREATEGAEEREAIERIERLAPHNFQFAHQWLSAIRGE
ncbi:unnamed protein product, partial [marine sediment metagenome]